MKCIVHIYLYATAILYNTVLQYNTFYSCFDSRLRMLAQCARMTGTDRRGSLAAIWFTAFLSGKPSPSGFQYFRTTPVSSTDHGTLFWPVTKETPFIILHEFGHHIYQFPIPNQKINITKVSKRELTEELEHLESGIHIHICYLLLKKLFQIPVNFKGHPTQPG